MKNEPVNELLAESGTKFSELAVASVRHDLPLSKKADVEGAVCTDISAADITEDHIDLTKRMLRLLSDVDGLGLAAPQVGVNKKFFVFWDEQVQPRVRYNPQYFRDGSPSGWHEKCLTYGPQAYLVKRFKAIRAIWYEFDSESKTLLKRTGRLAGQDAQVFQHETDHINGKTIAMIGTPI
jgi:peptide deformylase